MNLISSMPTWLRNSIMPRGLITQLITLAIFVSGLAFSRAATNSARGELETHVLSLLGSANTNRLAAPTSNPVVTPPPATNSQIPAVSSTVSTNSANSTNVARTNAPAVPSSMDIINLLDDRHKLVIGDRVSFRIIEDEDDPKPLMVADSGEIEVPYVGRQAAEGKTCRQLATTIKASLEKEYYYEATVVIAVDLMAKTRGRVYLVGALRAPGPQEIPTDETLTLSKAILRCGGFTDFSDKKNVKITRKTGPGENDKQTFIVNVGQIYDNGKVESDIPLEPGDLILVPDRKIRF